MLEAKLALHLLDIGDEPRLESEQVADELRDPPDKRVSVQPQQPRRQVGGDRLRHERRSRVKTVDDRQLDHLNVLSARCQTYNRGGETLWQFHRKIAAYRTTGGYLYTELH